MIKIESQIVINRPLNKVWEFFIDPYNLKFWEDGFVRYEEVSGERGRSGARSKHIYHDGKREVVFYEEILNVVNNQQFDIELSGEDVVAKVNNRFDPSPDDSTTAIKASSEMRFRSGLFRALAPVVKYLIKKRTEKSLKRLKEVLEKNY